MHAYCVGSSYCVYATGNDGDNWVAGYIDMDVDCYCGVSYNVSVCVHADCVVCGYACAGVYAYMLWLRC